MVGDLRLPWLLVASPQLCDPNFKRTVVLVVEHTSEGTLGFILNRPSDAPMANLVVEAPVKIPESLPAWFGGPVGTSTGVIIHNQFRLEGGFEGEQGFILSSTETTLTSMIDFETKREVNRGLDVDRSSCLYPFRFLIGYAGWGAGQLEEELGQGIWIQTETTDELLFNTCWSDLWERTLATIGVTSSAMVAPGFPTYLN